MPRNEIPPEARRAGHVAWVVLILVYSIFLSIIGWGIIDLVLPMLFSAN